MRYERRKEFSIGNVTLGDWFKISHHILNQSEVKAEPTVIFPALRRNCMHLPRVMRLVNWIIFLCSEIHQGNKLVLILHLLIKNRTKSTS